MRIGRDVEPEIEKKKEEDIIPEKKIF